MDEPLSRNAPTLLHFSFLNTVNLHVSPCPDPASGHDLSQAAALMWAHAVRFRWSKSFAYKKLHLVFEMLLSKALWQPVTILPTCFIALHTRLSGDQRHELNRGVPHCRRRRNNGFAFALTCKEKKSATFFISLNRDREIPLRHLDRWPSCRSSCWQQLSFRCIRHFRCPRFKR